MGKQILILQKNPDHINRLVEIFRDRGDEVQITDNLRNASKLIKRVKPDIVVFDIEEFGRNWKPALPKAIERLEGCQVIFTSDRIDPKDHTLAVDYKRWGVIRPPFTAYQIDQALSITPEAHRDLQGFLDDESMKQKIRFPIRFKITLPYIFLACVLAMGAAFIVTRVVYDTVEERFSNQLIEAGKLSVEWLVLEEERLLEQYRYLAFTRGIARALEEENSEELRSLTLPVVVNAGVGSVDFISKEGISVLSLRHREGGLLEEYDAHRGIDEFQDWPLLAPLFNGQIDAERDKYAGLISTSWGKYLYIAGPVYGGGENVVGYLLVGDPLESMVGAMREAIGAQLTAYTMEGKPIASTHLGMINPLSSEAIELIFAEQATSSYRRRFDSSDISYRELLGPLKVRDGKEVGILGIALSETFLLNTSQVTRVQVASFAAIGLGLVMFIGLYISGRLTQPLMNLVQASGEVARGNFHVHVEPSGSDEITRLSMSFNRMVTTLNRTNFRLLQSYDETLEAYDRTLEGWAKALEYRDKETEGHSQRVTEVCLRLAQELGISGSDLVHLRRGALLHDIGKMGIPDSILNKPASLSDQEWEFMQLHPTFAYQMIEGIEFLRPALDIPFCHHEKWDGSGYPSGMRGEEIPLAARIFTIVDVWDALLSKRPYRNAWSEEVVLEYLLQQRELHFDPHILDIFMDLLQRLGEDTMTIGKVVEPTSTGR